MVMHGISWGRFYGEFTGIFFVGNIWRGKAHGFWHHQFEGFPVSIFPPQKSIEIFGFYDRDVVGFNQRAFDGI